jgi:hypothetical protein
VRELHTRQADLSAVFHLGAYLDWAEVGSAVTRKDPDKRADRKSLGRYYPLPGQTLHHFNFAGSDLMSNGIGKYLTATSSLTRAMWSKRHPAAK